MEKILGIQTIIEGSLGAEDKFLSLKIPCYQVSLEGELCGSSK